MLEFTNKLSPSILLNSPQFKITVLTEPINVLKMLSRFPPSYDFSSSFFWVVICEKKIKIANQCLLFFLPTAKYNRDLRAHKIKRITTGKGQWLWVVQLSKSWSFWASKVPGILKGFCTNLSLIVLIKFVLITVSCQFNKLHLNSYPTYYPQSYREILLTGQTGKHSLSM